MMSRKKKRNKPYRGPDAADAELHVQRYTAVVRSPLGQWWQDHKKQVRLIAIIAGVVLFIGYLLFEFVRLLT